MEGVTPIEQEIAEVRRAVREKYRNFRRCEEVKEEQLKKKYQVLRDMIKEALVPEKLEVDVEEQEHSTLIDPWRFVTKRKKRKRSSYFDVFNKKPIRRPRDGSTELSSEVEEITEQGNESISLESHSPEPSPSGSNTQEATQPFVSSTPEVKVSNYGHYASEYVKKRINSVVGFDDVYGIQYHKTPQRFTLGDSFVTFNDDTVEVGEDMKIGCTPGLLELLFIENPDMNRVETHDLVSYKRILNETKAHKKRFSATEDYLVQPKHPKWGIIRKLFQPVRKPESGQSKSGSST